MQTSYDVVVIGGGIIGSAIAYYLAKNQVEVAVLEESRIGLKATSAAAGMLGAHSEYEGYGKDFFNFARYSQALYTELKDELYGLSGIDIGCKKGGILKLAFSEHDKKALRAILTLPTVKWLEANEVRNLEPDVSPKIIGAAYIEEDISVMPYRVCQAFLKGAQVYGASIFEHTNVLKIQKQLDTFQIDTTVGMFKAKRVVIAAGVWSNPFFQQLGVEQQITPVKGECIAVEGRSTFLKHTIFHDKYYIVPRNNGELVIGATMEENDWSEHVSLDGMETLIQKAKELFPGIGQMKMNAAWSGLRPQTFDQKPFIGFHPHDEAILFATGHYRNGILLAPATGEMIASFILNRTVKKEWVESFQINRPNRR
ncbi:glycine oxidase ThiO [Solibacillus sp. A46]|uniref:glycine oxidase n=1 Tax=Solibacillus faecavium TaxID=2762221 RepID=A0ABR8XVX4_9BACL|nr:glycine oxidase ThiO [Solibacillus faecavium]MBD8036088.1 glycine oxidase ThiO [Solibacillus faecavium]